MQSGQGQQRTIKTSQGDLKIGPSQNQQGGVRVQPPNGDPIELSRDQARELGESVRDMAQQGGGGKSSA